jgi:hypothetical protein
MEQLKEKYHKLLDEELTKWIIPLMHRTLDEQADWEKLATLIDPFCSNSICRMSMCGLDHPSSHNLEKDAKDLIEVYFQVPYPVSLKKQISRFAKWLGEATVDRFGT